MKQEEKQQDFPRQWKEEKDDQMFLIYVISPRRIVARQFLHFDSLKEAERYAEGITIGSMVCGTRYGALMCLPKKFTTSGSIVTFKCKNVNGRTMENVAKMCEEEFRREMRGR